MNILQFNVRLAEGGAAGVALDLHLRALQKRADVAFCLWLWQRRKKKRQPPPFIRR
ncbi:glycosyltransferase [Salmonella enterica subsp. enterica]|uniref:Glycosyltransferase n=1 Tax=Salmonella enterica I TaxID=59201 RepID=A0A447U0F4_SALET|nr:glycosyltransferase [Salmonella enterica subsp. enterica]